MENIKFAIFGDCGSQEIVINRKHTRAVGFINWYSLYSKPLQDDDVYKCIENIQMSQYNIRNLKFDLEKNALNYLLEEKANYLLLDPNDCRMQLGIRGKESVYTISTAGGELYKQISKLENWKRLTASDIPFDEYVKAIKMVCERIKEVYKSEEIILHIHKIVDVYTDGKIIGRLNNDKDPARKRSVQELLNKIYDALLVQPPDLVFVCQKPPDTQRVLVEDVAVVVGRDVHALDQQFAVLNVHPAVLQVDPAGTQAFDLGALELNAGLQRFQNEILMARFAVGGDGFGRRALLGGCHAARLLSPFSSLY